MGRFYQADPGFSRIWEGFDGRILGMTEQKPSVGRIVHYVSRGSADGKYAPEGMFFNRQVTHGEPKPDGSHEGGSWHWPERV